MALALPKKQTITRTGLLVGVLFVAGSSGWAVKQSLPVSAEQQSYMVTTAADSGPGSLRQAIINANANATTAAAPHEISFNIAGGGPHTVSLLSALPAIDQPTIIDGSTQSGSSCGTLVPQNPDGTIQSENTPHVLNVVISTSSIAGGAVALNLSDTAAGSEIRGLVIGGSQSTSSFNVGISAPDTVLECNYIGTNQAGDAAVSNAGAGGVRVNSTASDVTIQNNLISGNGQYGVFIQSAAAPKVYRNLVGVDATGNTAIPNRMADDSTGSGIYLAGTTDADVYKNVASGHRHLGIDGGTNAGIRIRGNYVGVNIDGSASIPNGSGIMMTTNGNSLIGGSTPDDRNVVSGNPGNNIRINGAIDTVIKGNYIGVGADGRTDLGHAYVSLYMGYQANNVVIGGSQPGEGNIIGNADGYGFTTEGDGTTNVTIQGNYFGTNPQGDNHGTSWRGVLLRSPGVKFGGSQPGEGNIVGFNGVGIRVEYTDTVLEGNYFGVLPDGTNVGNPGVAVELAVSNVMFGGQSNGQGNTVAYNHIGVNVYGSGNTLAHNSVYANTFMGIDLQGDGRTTNDYQDVDEGDNHLQNYPTSLSMRACDGTVEGPVEVFNSTPNTTFTIDFFSNPSWTPGYPASGEQWHSSMELTTDDDGDAPFTIPEGLVNPSFTATAPDGSTSELGNAASASFEECEMDYVTNDASDNVSFDISWNGSDIPNSYYDEWSGGKAGFELSVQIDDQPLTIDPDTNSNHQYSFSSWGLYARGSVTTPLTEGKHDVTITITDPATGLSMTHTFNDGLTVDTTPPATPVVRHLVTNDRQPQIQIEADRDDDVQATICKTGTQSCIHDDDIYLDIDFDESTGLWTVDPESYTLWEYEPETDDYIETPYYLDEGIYDVHTYVVDEAGNENMGTATGALVVDLTAPSGTVENASAESASPALNGTVNDPTAAVKVTVNGKTYTAVNDGNGTWTLVAGIIDSIETAGNYEVNVTFTDEAGNDSTTEGELTITLIPPAIEKKTANNGRPVIRGYFDAVNAQRLRVMFDGTWFTLGEDAELTANGNEWRLSFASMARPFAAGTYSITVEVTTDDGEILTDVASLAIQAQNENGSNPIDDVLDDILGPDSGVGHAQKVGLGLVVFVGIILLNIFAIRKLHVHRR